MEVKKVNMIHYLVVVAFCFFFRFIPCFAGITPLGMGILGTFIGAVYGWMTIGMTWPSVMALAGIGLTVGMSSMMTVGFGGEVVVILITSMMVVGPAMSNGAFNWVAAVMLNSKLLVGKGYLTIFVVFMIAWLFGCTNPIIMCVIFCAFMTSMFKQVGVQKDDPLVVFTFLGISYQLMRGQILFPFMGTGLAYLNIYNNMLPNLPMPVPRYLLMMGSMGIIMAVVFVALMKFVFRVDVSPLANYKLEGGVPKATTAQKQALALFIIFVVLCVINSLNLGAVSAFVKKFGVVGIVLVLAGTVPLLKDENGKSLGTLDELLHMVSWGQITMMAYIMTLSAYFTTPETGITTAMAVIFQPFMTLPPIVFIVMVMIIATVLTNVANNVIVTVLCTPFLVTFADQIGMDPIGIIALLFIISEFALATPAASPVTAVAFSQDMITPTAMSKAALKLLPILFVVFLIIGWPLAFIIF